MHRHKQIQVKLVAWIATDLLYEMPAAQTWDTFIASTARDAQSMSRMNELYGREYDQEKVTYNDIYFH